MGRLDERLSGHNVHGQIAALRDAFDELSEDAYAAAEEQSDGALRRVPEVLDYADALLQSADPNLVTATALETLSNAVSNALVAFNETTANPAQASAFDQQLESILTALTPLLAASQVVPERAGEVAEAFQTTVTHSAVEAQERLEDVTRELGEVEERQTNAATELDQRAEERKAALETAMNELQERVDTEKQRLDELVPGFETKFSEEQSGREERFTSEAAGFSTQAKETVEELQELRGKAERLYKVVTDTTTTAAFNKEAEEQQTAADRWRLVAMWTGAGAVALAVAFIVWAGMASENSAATSTGAIIAKVTATLAVAGVAAYAGRQSGRHRQREEEAKQLELELVAFPPFIETLEVEQQHEVRRSFAERAFQGRPIEAPRRPLFRKQDSFGLAVPELAAAIAAALRETGRTGN